jgi:glycosyltransferase involved in cell wall biosynthesis
MIFKTEGIKVDKIKLLTRAQFRTNFGYSWAALRLAKALKKNHAIDLKLENITCPWQTNSMPKEELTDLETSFENQFDTRHIRLSSFYPPTLDVEKCTGRITSTVFEADPFPKSILEALQNCDQVWVPTKFCRNALENSKYPEEKICVLPHIIEDIPQENVSSEFKEGRFKFLSIANFHDSKKNFDGLLRAYFKAFLNDSQVELVIKVNPEARGGVLSLTNKIRAKLGIKTNIPTVKVIGKHMSVSELNHLYKSCHAFVLLTHGEGWGLPYSEAMMHELPTIGTNWGGNLEFMNDGNSFLVDVERFEPAKGHIGSLFSDKDRPVMAVPCEEHAAYLMKQILQNYPAARKRAQKGRQEIQEKYSSEVVGDLAVTYLKELWQ